MAEQTILIGRRIAQARKAANLTQAELAAEIPGKSDGTQMSKWERGVHRPGDDTLEQIARVLDRDVAWFMAREPDKSQTPDPFKDKEPAADDGDRLTRVEQKLDWIIKALVPTTDAQAAELGRALLEAGRSLEQAQPVPVRDSAELDQ